jgi:hypothetical protein
MASNIVSTTIDAEYPVAGVDNDSQGFRDNFQIIKDNFAAAKEEVEDLQDNTARIDADSNFAGNKIISAELDRVTEAFTGIGTVNTDQNVSFLNGHYQSLLLSEDNINLTLADWPDAGGYAEITLQIELADGVTGPLTVVLVGEGNGVFKNDQTAGWTAASSTSLSVETNSTTSPTIVKFWTTDGGDTIYAQYLGVFAETSV